VRIAAALVILVIVASSQTRILQYGRRHLRNAKNHAHALQRLEIGYYYRIVVDP